MAKATGFTCDYKPCSRFVVGETLPKGWLTLRVDVDPSATGVTANTFEICSNECLARLAIDRAEQIDGIVLHRSSRVGGSKRGRGYTPEGLEAARRNGRHTAHKKSHVNKGVVNPDCEFCQELTAPVLEPA